MNSQVYTFLIFILYGASAGLLLDCFRVLRKSFKTSDIITYIEDIIFWIIIGISLVFTIFIFNDGEIRNYIFIGIALGVVAYMLLLSKYFMKISTQIINIIKYIIQLLIIRPIKTIFIVVIKIITIILKPITFILEKIDKAISRKKILLNTHLKNLNKKKNLMQKFLKILKKKKAAWQISKKKHKTRRVLCKYVELYNVINLHI